jgi:hypothetical protein
MQKLNVQVKGESQVLRRFKQGFQTSGIGLKSQRSLGEVDLTAKMEVATTIPQN